MQNGQVGVDIQTSVKTALTSDAGLLLPDAAHADRLNVVTDLGTAIGSQGQTKIKVVIDALGNIITAYPVR